MEGIFPTIGSKREKQSHWLCNIIFSLILPSSFSHTSQTKHQIQFSCVISTKIKSKMLTMRHTSEPRWILVWQNVNISRSCVSIQLFEFIQHRNIIILYYINSIFCYGWLSSCMWGETSLKTVHSNNLKPAGGWRVASSMSSRWG